MDQVQNNPSRKLITTWTFTFENLKLTELTNIERCRGIATVDPGEENTIPASLTDILPILLPSFHQIKSLSLARFSGIPSNMKSLKQRYPSFYHPRSHEWVERGARKLNLNDMFFLE
ncbi:hypothetical protein RF11_09699 [Thelohanellus kitauei]|uniref:Uncharacterized protein n=1 Tax=Thelohanellus kitauei TaxID=669202 RepID=A0A0C2MT07_THEKT|nr:hypothetical protein RF11_09699 [Thelohanellus kitauei]